MTILTTSFQKIAEAYLGTDSYNHSLHIRTYARYTEQDIANNRTYVIYQARTQFNGTYIQDNQGSYSLSGTGASGSSGSCTRPTNGEVTIATTEGWVYHDDKGVKSISASATLKFPNWGWSATASGGADLPTIPRESSIAVSNYNLGQNISITIGKKVSTFTSTLTYKIGSRTGTIATKTSNTPFVWEMPEELISQIKQDNSNNSKPNATIYCDTYNGNTKIGNTRSATFTLYITDKPTIDNIEIEETIELIKQYTTSVVKYLSVPQLYISTTSSEGTYISKYIIKIGDREINSVSANVTVNNIQYSYLTEEGIRKTKFVVICTDARGNSSEEYPLEVDFIEYVKLAFNNTDITFNRLNKTSNFIKLHITGYIYNGLIGETQNNLMIRYRYKRKKDSEAVWSELKTIDAILNDDNTFIINSLQLEEEFDYRENYDIEFYAEDLFISTIYSSVIKTSETILKVHKNGIDAKNLTINTNQVLYDGIQENYSLEEQKVGTWMGMNLYRKVIEGNMPNTMASWVDLIDLSNLKINDVVKISGTLKNTLTDERILPANGYETSNYSCLFSYLGKTNKLQVYVKGWILSEFGFKYRVVIEYTKTTDIVEEE